MYLNDDKGTGLQSFIDNLSATHRQEDMAIV